MKSPVFAVVSLCIALAPPAHALDGPFAVTTGSYKFLGRDEPLVATDRKVDLWAEVYRPTVLSGGPLPVAVFLHGNHATCGVYDKELQIRKDSRSEYTRTGECTPSYVVVPNHLGYEYLAKELASWGYMVVSINANRGITGANGAIDSGDSGLNLMRGRLILRHLALLSDWNRGTGKIPAPTTLKFDPRGTMDLSQVGLMGHSRGGEGARAALQQFRDEGSPFPTLIGGLSIKSIFEIGPVDGQTSRVLDADGVNSMVLLPACDGDVSNLMGMKVFDRVFQRTAPDTSKTFHGTVYVWGANHNAYNTEWQVTDSPGCKGGDALFQQTGRSKPQQLTAVQTLVPFFRATVGAKADPSLAAQFDPANPMPSALLDITNADRGYLPAPLGDTVQKLETFSRETGKSDAGIPTTSKGLTVIHQEAGAFDEWFAEHQPGTRVANLSWTPETTDSRLFQLNFRPAKDMSGFKTLSFRTALRCFGEICDYPASADGEMAYGVRLFDGNGQASNTYLTSKDVRLSRPTGYGGEIIPIGESSIVIPPQLHPVLFTVQIPLSAFAGVDLTSIKALRFTFHGQPVGSVDIGSMMLLKSEPVVDPNPQVASRAPTAMMAARVQQASMVQRLTTADSNTLTIVRKPAAARAGGASAAAAGEKTVDMVVTSNRPFPITDAFPRLQVGNKTIQGGVIGPDGKTMTISVPEATFNALPAGADVSLSLLASSPPWKFGALKK